MQSTKQAIFKVGEEEFGLDILDVITIEKFITIEPVANFPQNLKGIIRLRGDVIPVFSFRKKFGLEDIKPNDDTRFIITTSNGILVAYEVDQMMEIIPVDQEQMNEVPSVIKNKDTTYMRAVTNNQGQLVILLDQNGILSDEEQAKIKAVINK